MRLGHDSFWCDYTLRIPDAPQYHQALLEWLQRYHERTGRPQDQIVRFEAFVIWQDSPKPGAAAAADQHPQAALPALAGDGGAIVTMTPKTKSARWAKFGATSPIRT